MNDNLFFDRQLCNDRSERTGEALAVTTDEQYRVTPLTLWTSSQIVTFRL